MVHRHAIIINKIRAIVADAKDADAHQQLAAYGAASALLEMLEKDNNLKGSHAKNVEFFGQARKYLPIVLKIVETQDDNLEGDESGLKGALDALSFHLVNA